MKITKMALNKSALAAMFLVTTFGYSTNVQARVCEAEFNKIINDSSTKKYGFEEGTGYTLEEFTQKRYEIPLETGVYVDWESKDIGRVISTSEEYYEREKLSPNMKPEWKTSPLHLLKLSQYEFELCMLKAQRDGTLKSTKQAKNSKVKNTTAESEQSQSANTNSQDASNSDTSSNTKPLTKAELKAQKAEQQAQQDEQQAQQATQLAQEHQTKANQKRQGKRRRHEPENEAHNCIKPDFGGLYGGMENTCNFKVWYTYCGYRPTENSWLRGMSCEKQSFGSDIVGPGKQSASHTHGVEKLYWFACKDPAWPVDVEFDGDIKGRCHTVGGGGE